MSGAKLQTARMPENATHELLEKLDRNVLYAPEQDMWVRLEDDGTATIGATHLVTHHGQFMLFSPRPVGATIARDRSLGVMETAKTAVAVHAPLSCEIVEVNPAVLRDVAVIEREPYGAGWMFRVRPTLVEERAGLLDADAYAQWLAPRLAEKLKPPIDDSADLDIDPLRGW